MRVISGTAGGRNFEAPPGKSTRPTTDRVKEAMFAVIHFELQGAVALDLFSGSGSLAFEAISRGAKEVIANDTDRACSALIKKNAALLGFQDRCRVTTMDYRTCIDSLSGAGHRFDLVFLDPPYEKGMAQDAVSLMVQKGLLKAEAIVVVEHKKDEDARFALGIKKRKKYGDTMVTYLSGMEEE